MAQDLRYALHSLLKSPWFTSIAVLTLAIGIGGTTAIFSVVNGVLLKALPYPQPDRMVMVWESAADYPRMSVSSPNFRDWHAQSHSFAGLAAYAYEGGRMVVLGGDAPVFATVVGVTRDFFTVVGVQPAIGRTFTADETRENGTPAVLVSDGLWHRILGADRDLRALSLSVFGMRASIVGVMPPGFSFPQGGEVWFPLERFPDDSGRTGHNLRVAGRLAPGVSLAQAQAEMTAIAARVKAVNGDDDDATDARVVGLHDQLVGGSRRTLLLLFGAVALVLLAACANVASGLLARGAERRKELAIRMSLGAKRARLVRLLLTENLVLAGAGGVVGLVLAGWLVRALVAAGPTLPASGPVGIDGRVVAFALALSLLTPLVFGLLPSVQVSRTEIRDALAEGGRQGAPGGRTRTRHAFVTVEVALALLLLAGSGLLVRSFLKVLAVDPGFDPSRVLALETSVPGDSDTAAQAADFYRRLLERVRQLPGIAHAALINAPPLGGDANGAFLFEGQRFEDIRSNWAAQAASYRVASDDYFATLGIPILRGRAFTDRDRAGTEPVAVISQAMARKFWPGRDPLGQRIRFAGMDRVNPWLTIVGIAGDVRHSALTGDVEPAVYVHYLQNPERVAYFVTIAVRTAPAVDPATAVTTLRQTVAALDPNVPVEFSTMEARVASSVADRRFTMLVLFSFGAVSLLLAAIGLYGVLAYSVVRRTQEIGIRMALGADPGSVVGLVLKGAMGSVLTGVVIGLAATLALTRLLRSLLFEVTPTDPVVLVAALAVLGAVAWIAAYGPARRAARVDPLVAMRVE
jgi:predicted permease